MGVQIGVPVVALRHCGCRSIRPAPNFDPLGSIGEVFKMSAQIGVLVVTLRHCGCRSICPVQRQTLIRRKFARWTSRSVWLTGLYDTAAADRSVQRANLDPLGSIGG